MAAVLVIVEPSIAEHPFIDFSADHSIERVKDSGVDYSDISSGISFLRVQSVPLTIGFPGGRELSFHVRRGSFNYDEDSGTISTVTLYTELMPADEAAEVMRIFKRSLGETTEDVDRWLAEVAENKHHQPLKFRQMGARSETGVHYPRIRLVSKSSMNPTYEWELEFSIEWSPVLFPEGWNESMAAEHNPRPPEGYERISLDPPSGRFYSREEGVRKALERGEESGSQAGSDGVGGREEGEHTHRDDASPEVESESLFSSRWLWVVIAGILLVATVSVLSVLRART